MTRRFLLDTNVLSETRKRQPNANVVGFLGRRAAADIFVSALTIGELRKGVKGKRRTDKAAADRLEAWVDGIEWTFAERILSVDARVARFWGELSAERSRPVVDTLIGATALAHGLILATRNTRDFVGTDLVIIDPFDAPEP